MTLCRCIAGVRHDSLSPMGPEFHSDWSATHQTTAGRRQRPFGELLLLPTTKVRGKPWALGSAAGKGSGSLGLELPVRQLGDDRKDRVLVSWVPDAAISY
jgi:hypothetical protein